MTNKNFTFTPKSVVAVIGGTGFLGQYIVKKLAKKGCIIKVLSRNATQSGKALKFSGSVGQISLIDCDVRNAAELTAAIADVDVVINLVGILYEQRRRTFKEMHVELPKRIAKACKELGVKRLVHVSALGVDRACQTSVYAKTKYEGEKALLNEFNDAVVLRPSVIFGSEDNFINMFARVLKIFPLMPLIGRGLTKFQPVYVGDVAEMVMKVIEAPHAKVAGKTFEIAGPDQMTLREIIEFTLQTLSISRVLISIPFFIGKIQGAILEHLPNKMLTRDQVELLKYDNILIGNNGLVS